MKQTLHIAIIFLTMFVVCGCIDAQEAYRVSWVMQDKMRGLTQEIARNVISRTNDWLTRDDPTAPTARLDDLVRVTVIGEVLPPGSRLRTRLAQLVVGTIVVPGGFEEFLDTALISSIIRRNYFWRDETFIPVNESLNPYYTEAPLKVPAPDNVTPFEPMDSHSVIRIALAESSFPMSEEFRAWIGLGFADLGLPDFSYGKVRVGMSYENVKAWGEIPLSVGSIDNPLLARGVDGTFGLGLSFASDQLAGALTWGQPSLKPKTNAAPDDARYALDRSALFHLYLVNSHLSWLDGNVHVRIALGGSYQHVSFNPHDTTGSADIAYGRDRLAPVLRAVLTSRYSSNSHLHDLAIGLFGDSFTGSCTWQFNTTFGLNASVAVHGLLGDRAVYLPAYSFMISPTITIR